jgi:hypothetical protein
MKSMKGLYVVNPNASPVIKALQFFTQRTQRRGEIWVREGLFAQWGILNIFILNKERIEKIINPLDY